MQTDPFTLREFRVSRNLSQAEMAALLNTPTGTLKNWEQGRTVPPGCLAVALLVFDLEDELSAARSDAESLAFDRNLQTIAH